MGWGSQKCRALYLQASMQQKISETSEKNSSIKMLMDVGMTVPKGREASTVYMEQDRG